MSCRLPTTPAITKWGCYVDGVYFAPGESMEEGKDEASHWCYGTMCGENGNIIHWDNFECYDSTTTPTTSTSMTTFGVSPFT